MKILVTGGTGFLGRHLVWRLAAYGHAVTFSGRNAAQAHAVMAAAAAPVRFVRMEHGAPGAGAALQAALAGADAVIHCAALASPWGPHRAFRQANVGATREVLAACRAHRIERLVHISSPSVYFDYRDRLGIVEDDPLPAGVNHYARTKREAELLVLDAGLRHSVILRPRAIFGPWDNALLPRLLRLLRHGKAPLLRGGRTLIDLTYVDNVVDAVLLALALPARHGAPPIFNIANGEPIEAAALFEKIATHFSLRLDPVARPYALADIAARTLEAVAHCVPGWEPPLTRYSLGVIAFSQTLDLTRARDLLGYAPRVALDDGFARTAQWWRAQGRAA